jgi:hypothetical protein
MVMTNLHAKYVTMGQRILGLLGGEAFLSQEPCDLDLGHSDLKINRSSTSHNQPQFSISNMKTVDQSILKQLSGLDF